MKKLGEIKKAGRKVQAWVLRLCVKLPGGVVAQPASEPASWLSAGWVVGEAALPRESVRQSLSVGGDLGRETGRFAPGTCRT